jgi:hypothetical protein
VKARPFLHARASVRSVNILIAHNIAEDLLRGQMGTPTDLAGIVNLPPQVRENVQVETRRPRLTSVASRNLPGIKILAEARRRLRFSEVW